MSTHEDRVAEYTKDAAVAASLGMDYDEYLAASDAKIAEAKGWGEITLWVPDVMRLRQVLDAVDLDYVVEE